MKIKCQHCNPKSRKLMGCFCCYGYGFILEKSKCPTCKTVYWERPGVHTVYEGKQYTTFDGLTITYSTVKPTCSKCEETK